ncbi:MAG: hypothetical protein WDN01_05420 [Rhizomicrobium sp.]
MPQDHSPSEHLAVDFGIVLHAWGALRAALAGLPRLFLSAALATALLTFAAWKLQGAYHDMLSSAPGTLRDAIDFGYTLLVNICDCVVMAAVAVPVHRMVLLGETRDGVVALFAARTWRFAFWLVVLETSAFLALLPLPLLLRASPVETYAVVTAMAAFLLALAVVAVRLSLIFPAIATDMPAGASWTLSRGRFWRVVVTAVFTLIPLLFVMLLATLAASWLVGLSGSLGNVFDTLMWFEIVVTALSRPIGVALASAVLSWNYRLAREEAA